MTRSGYSLPEGEFRSCQEGRPAANDQRACVLSLEEKRLGMEGCIQENIVHGVPEELSAAPDLQSGRRRIRYKGLFYTNPRPSESQIAEKMSQKTQKSQILMDANS